jgi:hypothetical protein
MKNAIKTAGWAALVALLLLAAAAISAKLYFTPARLKKLTLDYAARNLRREVTFDSVSLGLSGFSITNLRVSEYPDFKSGEFLSAADFSVRPSLGALLHREIRVNSVSASGLKLRVTEVRKNVYNFSDLMAAPAAQGAKPAAQQQQEQPKKQAAMALAVSSFKVKDSLFNYTNAAGDMKVELRNIDLSASGISPEGLFPVQGSFTMDVVSPYFKGSIPASIKGKVALGNFDMEKGRAEIEAADLSLGGVKAEINGSLSDLLEPDARLTLKIKEFSTADLKTVFKGLPAKVLLPEIDADADFKLTTKDAELRSVAFKAGPVSGSLKGRAAWDPKVTYDISADVKAQVPEIDTTQLARRLKQFSVPGGIKLPLASVSAAMTLKDGRADITAFSLDCAALSASGRTQVNFGGPALKASGSAKAEIKSLAKLAEMAPGLAAAYAPTGTASASLDYSYAGALSVKGKASFGGVGAAFQDHELSGLGGSLDFTKDSAAAPDIAGKLDGEDLKASFSARDLTLKDLPATAAPGANGAAAHGVPAAAAGAPFYMDVSGKAEVGAIEHPNFHCGPASMKMNLVNISADMKALDGSASFTAGPGKFAQLYSLADRYKAAKVALYPLLVLQKASKLGKALHLPDFNNIDFDRIEGDYSFGKGLMKINKSSLTATVANVSSSGSIDLPAEKLDMRISTQLKQASGITMTAPVAMTVKGTFDNPSVKADIKSLAEQPAVKKALDKAFPGASKLLKGLFKK